MADITMCSGYNDDIACNRHSQCYRHTATANEYRQAYFMNIPLVVEDGVQKCDYYWDNKGR